MSDRLDIPAGGEAWQVTLDPRRLLAVTRAEHPAAVADPVDALIASLENPVEYPAVRRAFVPGDRVTVVVDTESPRLTELLGGLLGYLTGPAGQDAGSITLLTPPETDPDWVELIPDEFDGVRLEQHAPASPESLAYLATTQSGRRVYLNKHLTECDQSLVLGRRTFDPFAGYGGAAAALFPAFSDGATRREYAARLSLAGPGEQDWPARHDAEEVAWLLGAPVFVQVIPGADGGVAGVVTGPVSAAAHGERRLEALWAGGLPHRASMALVRLGGAYHTFDDLSRAAATAGRAVGQGGYVFICCGGAVKLPPAVQALRAAPDAMTALRSLRDAAELGKAAALRWAATAARARLHVAGGLDAETAESLFATPLKSADDLQQLLDEGGEVAWLPDGHLMNLTLAE